MYRWFVHLVARLMRDVYALAPSERPPRLTKGDTIEMAVRVDTEQATAAIDAITAKVAALEVRARALSEALTPPTA